MQYIVLNKLNYIRKIIYNKKIFNKIENKKFYRKNVAGMSYCEKKHKNLYVGVGLYSVP